MSEMGNSSKIMGGKYEQSVMKEDFEKNFEISIDSDVTSYFIL